MKIKSIGIFVLSLLLIAGLLQVEAIGNLNSIFHSVAVSIRRVVKWIWGPYTLRTQRTTLSLEHEFLNVDNSQNATSLSVKKSVSPQREGPKVIFNEPRALQTDDVFNLLNEDFSYSSQDAFNESIDSSLLPFLHEVADSGDPVTELFPETEWYDEIDTEDYDWIDLLEGGEEEDRIILDERIRSEFVEPLLDEMKTQIQEKLESDSFDDRPEE